MRQFFLQIFTNLKLQNRIDMEKKSGKGVFFSQHYLVYWLLLSILVHCSTSKIHSFKI